MGKLVGKQRPLARPRLHHHRDTAFTSGPTALGTSATRRSSVPDSATNPHRRLRICHHAYIYFP